MIFKNQSKNRQENVKKKQRRAKREKAQIQMIDKNSNTISSRLNADWMPLVINSVKGSH